MCISTKRCRNLFVKLTHLHLIWCWVQLLQTLCNNGSLVSGEYIYCSPFGTVYDLGRFLFNNALKWSYSSSVLLHRIECEKMPLFRYLTMQIRCLQQQTSHAFQFFNLPVTDFMTLVYS